MSLGPRPGVRALPARRRHPLDRRPARDQQPCARPSRLAARRAGAHADVGLPARALSSSWPATRAFPTAASGAPRRWWHRCSPAWPSPPRCSRRSGRCGRGTRWPPLDGSCCRVASLVGHWMVPPAVGGEGEPVVERRTLDQFERQAYRARDADREPGRRRRGRSAPPLVPALWNQTMATPAPGRGFGGRALGGPGAAGRRRAAAPGLARPRARCPADTSSWPPWRTTAPGPRGEALFYRPQDTVPQPLVAPLLDLGPAAFHARAPGYRIGRGDEAGSRARFVAAADPARVGAAGARAARAARARCPGRLGADARPPAGPARALRRMGRARGAGRRRRAALARRRLCPGQAFPLATRIEWRGQRVGRAPRGACWRPWRRRPARPGSTSGRAATRWPPPGPRWPAGVVEPATSMPDAVWRAAPVPGRPLPGAVAADRAVGRAPSDPPAGGPAPISPSSRWRMPCGRATPAGRSCSCRSSGRASAAWARS